MMDDTSRPADPMAAGRRPSSPVLPARFYRHAAAVPEAGSWALHLDGKRAMTPGRAPLSVPGERFAEVMAAEWNAQRDRIDPASMPVTRLANTAIDGVALRLDEVREATRAYGETDLLCYRAGGPDGLVSRQQALWDPIIAWAERRFGVRFILAEGVMPVAQPEPALAALRAAVSAYEEPFSLAGLNLATTLSGSLLIGLALDAGFVGPEEGWAAAHVDEDWNISQWGEDTEASERRARRFADFRAAALALGR